MGVQMLSFKAWPSPSYGTPFKNHFLFWLLPYFVIVFCTSNVNMINKFKRMWGMMTRSGVETVFKGILLSRTLDTNGHNCVRLWININKVNMIWDLQTSLSRRTDVVWCSSWSGNYDNTTLTPITLCTLIVCSTPASSAPNDHTIGCHNLNPLSHSNTTLAPHARQARASGENLNYVTLAPQARPSG